MMKTTNSFDSCDAAMLDLYYKRDFNSTENEFREDNSVDITA